ncbi:hypothetical protein G9A89_014707 [Geosiphon pyriformis]|nr:hypothetical protein G9A89_014707 [Geosiphon pyriformis]
MQEGKPGHIKCADQVWKEALSRFLAPETIKNLEKAFELYSKAILDFVIIVDREQQKIWKVENQDPQNKLETRHRNGWTTTKNPETHLNFIQK